MGLLLLALPACALETAAPHTVETAMSEGPTIWPSMAKITITAVLVALMLFTRRPWCPMLYPLGAIYSLCNSLSLFHVRLNRSGSHDCILCESLCKHGEGPTQRANDLRCIRCLDCTKCNRVVLAHIATASDSGDSDGGSKKLETISTGGSPHETGENSNNEPPS